jgi:hypothetical protein
VTYSGVDFPKKANLMAYISRPHDWITQKGDFDGLHNKVM